MYYFTSDKVLRLWQDQNKLQDNCYSDFKQMKAFPEGKKTSR